MCSPNVLQVIFASSADYIHYAGNKEKGASATRSWRTGNSNSLGFRTILPIFQALMLPEFNGLHMTKYRLHYLLFRCFDTDITIVFVPMYERNLIRNNIDPLFPPCLMKHNFIGSRRNPWLQYKYHFSSFIKFPFS